MTDRSLPSAVKPLERRDPPALGDVTLTGRIETTETGTLYAGTLGDEDVIVVLLSDGAERDSFARARFGVAVGDLKGSSPEAVVATDSDEDIAPWVALADCEPADALALLGAVTMDDVDPVGAVMGPDFRPHWWDRGGPGRWRLWPLPWPRSLSEATIATFIASFAIVLAIAALALWIAVKLFEGQGPAPVYPPFPTNGTGDTTITPSNPTPTQPTPSTTGPTTTGTGPSPTGPTGTGDDVPPIV